MASLLHPSYALTIAGQQWTQQAVAIDLLLGAAPLCERLSVIFPADVPIEAAPDDAVTLDLDGGEGAQTVFTGKVASIRRGFDAVRVTALGAVSQLARYRPAATFENVSAATVIRALAGDAGVEVGEIAEGVTLRAYIADPSRTAADHCARLASWSGAMLASDADGALTAAIIDATQADLALRYGREIIALHLDDAVAPETLTIVGESGASDAAAPEALRPTGDFFAGSRPDGPGAGTIWRWEPALRTAMAAGTASAAEQRLLAASQRSGRLDAFLVPALRPGVVVELQDLPAGFSGGPWWLDAVRHRIGPDGATSQARLMQGGDSFDPLALLGSLGGALAGAF